MTHSFTYMLFVGESAVRITNDMLDTYPYSIFSMPKIKNSFCLFWKMAIAIFLVTRDNPKQMERGMDFLHDVVDWIGGYPYEYDEIEEIRNDVCRQGFSCLRIRAAQVPTGCNEFVFKRTGTPVRS